MKGKDVNFKELAGLADDWREAKARWDAADKELGKLSLPQKPTEFRNQKQYDEYMKLIAEYDKAFNDVSARIHREQEAVSRVEYAIREWIGPIPATWFIVECKDKSSYGVYVKHNFDEMDTVLIKPWDKKQPGKKD